MGTSSKTGEEPAHREHRFGASPPLTIGVEEELLLVDAGCVLVAEAERVLESLDPDRRAAVSTEIFAAQIELKTGICHDVAQATAELEAVRRSVSATGARLMGSGLYPGESGGRPWSKRRATCRSSRTWSACWRRRPAGCTSTSAFPIPKPRSPLPTRCATTCRCWRR